MARERCLRRDPGRDDVSCSLNDELDVDTLGCRRCALLPPELPPASLVPHELIVRSRGDTSRPVFGRLCTTADLAGPSRTLLAASGVGGSSVSKPPAPVVRFWACSGHSAVTRRPLWALPSGCGVRRGMLSDFGPTIGRKTGQKWSGGSIRARNARPAPRISRRDQLSVTDPCDDGQQTVTRDRSVPGNRARMRGAAHRSFSRPESGRAERGTHVG